MNKVVRKSFQYGSHHVTLETGIIARQATGAVLISMGDTVLLATVVAKKEAVEGQDFFPLTVHYQEKTYAAGRIPGGYFKREGRPTEKETLTSRLIDRPIRPLFPEGFKNEVQIVVTLMSVDPDVQADVPAMLGASAALAITGVPFGGPIGAARVGYINNEYVLNPSSKASGEGCRLNLVVAGTQNAVLMVESEADLLPEDVMLGAVKFGHDHMQTAIQAIREFAAETGVQGWGWKASEANLGLVRKIADLCETRLVEAYQIREKAQRQDRIKEITAEVVATLVGKEPTAGQPTADQVSDLVHELEAKVVRGRILDGHPRIDGRNTTTVRPISIELGVLPRTHGSALFTRGETQALVVSTLGTDRDGQIIDDIEGERRDDFMLHYNFPPYSVGETGPMTGPKRREVGHGKLAKRALQAVVPTLKTFPYTLRVVSEITESNGSSSMASVCGGSLSLMDAGVPLKAPVAGIAMGLIKEGDKFAVLTDILGDEDHLGDMDFKVAGSKEGVTALQMDIKIDGITFEIMQKALEQAKHARLHILGIMDQALSAPREEVSIHAPKLLTMRIHPDKIREVIGKGGATIRALTEETRTTIDISDEGIVKIAALNGADGEAAKKRIEAIVADLEVGKIYEGKIVKLVDFGAFVEVLPGKQGMVHISQIREERVENIRDELSEGQIVTVKVVEVDRQGRVRLSIKDAKTV